MNKVFEDRQEAGRQIAKKLVQFKGTDAIIMAIPMGGIPVAAAAAHRLQIPWNIIVSQKLPIPWNPKAGFGAVAADGSIVLNEAMVHGLQLRKQQIEDVENSVRTEVMRRDEFFSINKPHTDVSGKCVILIDDGLASGYTMLAAIKSLRSQLASRIVAVAPIASRSAALMIEKAADECVFETVSPAVPFAIADFYLQLNDLSDEDIIEILRG